MMFGLPKIAIYAVLALALLGSLTWLYSAIKDTGVQQERQRVERLNAEAVDAARKSRVTLSECYDRGGEWDQSAGRCSK